MWSRRFGRSALPIVTSPLVMGGVPSPGKKVKVPTPKGEWNLLLSPKGKPLCNFDSADPGLTVSARKQLTPKGKGAAELSLEWRGTFGSVDRYFEGFRAKINFLAFRLGQQEITSLTGAIKHLSCSV